MTQVYKLLGIDARTNTFYHPASQGKVERSHQVIANMLAKFVSSGQTDWDLYVPQCMMAMNTSVHSATGFSPYYLVHGRHPTLPPDPSKRPSSGLAMFRALCGGALAAHTSGICRGQ